jgi:hypothetical protein
LISFTEKVYGSSPYSPNPFHFSRLFFERVFKIERYERKNRTRKTYEIKVENSKKKREGETKGDKNFSSV